MSSDQARYERLDSNGYGPCGLACLGFLLVGTSAVFMTVVFTVVLGETCDVSLTSAIKQHALRDESQRKLSRKCKDPNAKTRNVKTPKHENPKTRNHENSKTHKVESMKTRRSKTQKRENIPAFWFFFFRETTRGKMCLHFKSLRGEAAAAPGL